MKITQLAGAIATAAVIFGVGAVAPASATSNIQLFGVQETLKDMNGPLIGYTVTGLMPSADPIPYPFAGRPYEATVKADALVGTVTPVVPYFNARAENGDNYGVLANVSTLSGAPIGQGGSTTGKVYFDVVGADPNSVIFNNGAEDILGWVQPPGFGRTIVFWPAASHHCPSRCTRTYSAISENADVSSAGSCWPCASSDTRRTWATATPGAGAATLTIS